MLIAARTDTLLDEFRRRVAGDEKWMELLVQEFSSYARRWHARASKPNLPVRRVARATLYHPALQIRATSASPTLSGRRLSVPQREHRLPPQTEVELPPRGDCGRGPIRQARDGLDPPPPVTIRAAVITSSGGSAIAASCAQVAQCRDCCCRSAVHTCRPQIAAHGAMLGAGVLAAHGAFLDLIGGEKCHRLLDTAGPVLSCTPGAATCRYGADAASSAPARRPRTRPDAPCRPTLPQLAHCVTSSTPTGSLLPPSQYLTHTEQRRRLPWAHPRRSAPRVDCRRPGRSCRRARDMPSRPHGRPRRRHPRAPCSTAAGRQDTRARARHTPAARPRDSERCHGPRRSPRRRPSSATSTPRSRNGRGGRSRGSWAGRPHCGHATIQAAAPVSDRCALKVA